MKDVIIGSTYTSRSVVTDKMTAIMLGSGDASVYATPMLIALMENSAFECLQQFTEQGESSVGISISASHVVATPVGLGVHADAVITNVDGKKVDFEIKAYDEFGLIGEATHSRFVVNSEKFQSKADLKVKQS